MKNKKVAVIGGGPGGLTLARLLQLKGVHVKLYERDANPAARVQGSPLDLHESSGWEALRKANLVAAFQKSIHRGADKKIIVNERAEIIFSDHEAQSDEDPDSETIRPEIDRGALRKIFLESLQPETVVWDSQFVSMEKEIEGWILHFKDGSSDYADLVIAADGAHSRIRPYVTAIKAFYSGVTMVEINIDNAAVAIPNIHAMLKGGKIMAFGNEKNILGGQKENGGLGFYLSFKPNENWASNSGLDFSDKTQLLAWFESEYSEWSDIWYELFENASMPVIPRPIYCMPLDQTWETLPNLTLLGDAAHVMPPFAGEGANTAMFDALELSECLTSDQFHNLQEALFFYEVSMRKRAAVAAEQSLENGKRMHAKDALGKMLAVFGIK
ncbi:FAD-dependent oxidoreductase [Pedobacter metabolipauper]|uniref:Flavin-dependent monooxygenase n=1 Tax=Pedobacter metabolipauper TaxID=425513 RepID=A0A4R6SYJ2_9SPHI|nr:NAD(P)/FAD-dependent oxidoreductase [Pedobacter metabolipauper]TDQ11102.1 2-polyprenyl-6-methoxyphenol hydroxylase-like FAD-dependent oxidoreductase [Pedobacter metabolipauper]